MLKSIAKVRESDLSLGRLKLNVTDSDKKNIEKTIAYIKRRTDMDEKDNHKALLEAVVDLLDYDSDLISDVRTFSESSLGLGVNVDYSEFIEFRYNDSDIRNMIYFDLSGKLPKAKNGGRYKWRNVKKGKFTVYDGKRLVASYKLINRILNEATLNEEEKLDTKNYFRDYLFVNRKYSYRSVDNKIMKLILDIYQDDISIQAMIDYEKSQSGEYAKAFMTKKNITKQVQERMDNTIFRDNGFSFVEFDNDTDLEKLTQVEGEWLEVYPKLPKIKNITTDLRFRKLGKHKANGIYFPTQHCLSVDIRSVSSMIHEYAHLMDYELYSDIISLRPEFRDIIKSYSYEVDKLDKTSYVAKKKNYYTTPTEVFARGFELYIKEHIKTSFLKSEEDYNTLEEYACFTESNRQKLNEFFNTLLNTKKEGVAKVG